MAIRKVDHNIQDLCLINIIKNLPSYVRYYHALLRGGYTDLNFHRLHVLFSQRIIALLRDRRIVSDADCPSDHHLAIDFLFLERDQPTEEEYLSFFLNPHLKNLDIGFGNPRRKRLGVHIGTIQTNDYVIDPQIYSRIKMRPFLITTGFWNTFLNIGKNLTVINMEGCDIEEEDFAPFLRAIPQVVDLNLSHTCFSDSEIPIIRVNCPLLRRLELAGTDISDDGIRYLCEADSDRGDQRTHRLVFLNLHSTQITFEGAKNILRSFPSLEIFQYFSPDMFSPIFHPELDEHLHSFLRWIPITMGNAGLPSILHEMHEPCPTTGEVLNIREYKLKELVIGMFEQTEKILQTTLLCSPALTSLKILPPVTAQGLLLCSKFPNLENVEIHLGPTIPITAVEKFFSIQGPRLQVVSFAPRFVTPKLEYAHVLYWLIYCQKLRNFSFQGVQMYGNRIRYKPSYSLLSLRKISISYLSGSGAKDFLEFLLCAVPQLTHLRLSYIDADVDTALNEANNIHNFRHLKKLKILNSNVHLQTVSNFWEKRNLKCLEYDDGMEISIE